MAVSTSQAGERIACVCGTTLEVPTLRRMQELAPAQQIATEAASWGFRQGALSLGLILAAFLALGGAWYTVVEPAPPAPIDLVAREAAIRSNFANLTPLSSWSLWINAYKPLGLVGLSEVQSLEEVATAQRIEICRSRRNYLLMAAGVVLVLSVVAYLAAPR